MAFASTGFLAGLIAALTTRLGRFHALAVHNGYHRLRPKLLSYTRM
jgi:hypothetical protein